MSLFFVATISILVQISATTAILKIDLLEMLEFYLYNMHDVIIYTLPISFFAASTIALSRISGELELIVLFSIGANKTKIIKHIVLLGLIVFFTSLVFSMLIKPQAIYKKKEFIYKKQSTAELNLKPSEFGQSFGDFMVFVKKKNEGNSYEDIVVYSKDPSKNMFIVAKNASIINRDGVLSLYLKQGHAYGFKKNEMQKADFEYMILNKEFKAKKLDFLGIIHYWIDETLDSNKNKEIYSNILFAAFPILSIFLIMSFGIYNPRSEKKRTNILILLTTITYFYFVPMKISFGFFVAFPIIWLGLSYALYRVKLKMY